MLGIVGQQCCVRFHGALRNILPSTHMASFRSLDAFGLNNRDGDDMIEHVNYCTSVKAR